MSPTTDSDKLPVTNDECIQCGSSDLTVSTVAEEFEYGDGDNLATLKAMVPRTQCGSCGFIYYDHRADDARHNAVCTHLGVLAPQAIHALRSGYGMTRAQFAEATRIGEATLGRWERGAMIQNAAYDYYLRLLHLSTNFDLVRTGFEERVAVTPKAEPRFRGLDDPTIYKSEQSAFRLVQVHALQVRA